MDKVLKNYRTESNLPVVSKIIEEAVGRQISRQLDNNGIGDVLQSAYKKAHNTETALLKFWIIYIKPWIKANQYLCAFWISLQHSIG